MATREASDSPAISLAYLPATTRQRRLVFAVAVLQLAAFGSVAPFVATSMPRFDAFIPTVESMIFVNDLVTSILLLAQYSIVPSRAILVLACGYLFTALIVIPHALSFPGAFSPTGLLGVQTTVWLYYLWHIGSPAAILAYACLKHVGHASSVKQGSMASIFGWCGVLVAGLVYVLTRLAIAADRFLPAIFTDTIHGIPGRVAILATSSLLLAVTTLVVLWIRRRSVIDYWLMLVVGAMISEQMLFGVLDSTRFSLGFYAGRIFSLATSIFVLVLLLEESIKLYARLARANAMLARERDNKLMNLEAVTASIAHEVKQPLTAIAANGSAALAFLGKAPPNIDEARASLNDIVDDSHQTSAAVDGIRALFKKADQSRQPIDMNGIALEVLQSMRGEFNDHGITALPELTFELPLIEGNRSQLQQVILNLIHNAVEAMNTATGRSRVLRLTTERRNRNAIALAVRDSGPGIDPGQLESIFDAFVTTKAHGMGLGLAICRLIVERHGGELTASSDGTNGALFQLVLPIELAAPLAPEIDAAGSNDESAGRTAHQV